MPLSDKHRAHSSDRAATHPRARGRTQAVQIAAAMLILISSGGCNRMITPRASQLVKDADARATEGDFLHAINLYESALDGSASDAETHYRLALLYDDKMHEPLNALHHFKRYLVLAPNGAHSHDAKDFMKRDELALVTSMSGDSVVTRAEAARLKNENLELRRQLEAKTAQARTAAASEKSSPNGKTNQSSSTKTGKSGPRSHVVEPGDTLFSLSRKYYNSTSHWKAIRNANRKSVDSSGKLKVGQTLTIP